LDILEYLTAAAAIAPDDVAMTALAQVIKVLAGDHSAIADQYYPFDSETLLQIMHDIGDGLGIAPVTLEHMVGDRPAIDQN
jgi:hypothetical protein